MNEKYILNNERILLREFDGSLIMLDTIEDKFLTTKGIGDIVIKLLDTPKNLEEIFRYVSMHYKIENTSYKIEITSFINDLVSKDIVNVV